MLDITNVSLPATFANGFQGIVPEPTVLPGHGGPIATSELTNNDVLSGRGGKINHFVGNVLFREIVSQHKEKYSDPTNKKIEKAFIAAKIAAIIRCLDPPGRFLQKDEKTGYWLEIGDEKARKKAGQALREDAARAEKKAHTPPQAPTSDSEQQQQPATVTPVPSQENIAQNKSDLTVSDTPDVEALSSPPTPPELNSHSSVSTIDVYTICSDMASIPEPTTFFRGDTLSSQILEPPFFSRSDTISSQIPEPTTFLRSDTLSSQILEPTIFFRSDTLSSQIPATTFFRSDTLSSQISMMSDVSTMLMQLELDPKSFLKKLPQCERHGDDTGYFKFSLTDQDMKSVGDLSSSDLLSDNADFGIAIPGLSENTFANFPTADREVRGQKSGHGRRQSNLPPCWNRALLSAAKTDFAPTVSFGFDVAGYEDMPLPIERLHRSLSSDIDFSIPKMPDLARGCSQSSGMMSLTPSLSRFMSDGTMSTYTSPDIRALTKLPRSGTGLSCNYNNLKFCAS